jgi:hypothetical protein
MRAARIACLVALGALVVPSWVFVSKQPWVGMLDYFGGLLIALLALIVREVWRERRAWQIEA